MKTTNISILRKQIKSYVDGVISTNEPVLVNKGADGVMIISLSEYNALMKLRASKDLDIPKPLLEDLNKKGPYVPMGIDEL